MPQNLRNLYSGTNPGYMQYDSLQDSEVVLQEENLPNPTSFLQTEEARCKMHREKAHDKLNSFLRPTRHSEYTFCLAFCCLPQSWLSKSIMDVSQRTPRLASGAVIYKN